jgi:ribosomal protein S25
VPGVFEDAVRAALVREQTAALDRLAADYPSRLTAALGRALNELEDEGVLVVVRERRQPVYHVTLARRLVGDAAP